MEPQTRELFWSLTTYQIAIFYCIAIAAMALFILGIWRHISRYWRGKTLRHPVNLRRGIADMLATLLTHRSIRRRDPIAGYLHIAVFYGFLIATAGTTIIFIDYDIIRPVFGVSLWKGNFYLITSLLLDLGNLALTIALIGFTIRRLRNRFGKLEYLRNYRNEREYRSAAKVWQREDWIFLLVLLTIEITGFLQESVRFVAEPVPWAYWSPIGLLISKVLSLLGMTPEVASVIRANNWWFHGVLALVFIAAFPWYKAKHALTALVSLGTRNKGALQQLALEDSEQDSTGYGTLADFNWKELATLDACTKCGRCHEACPAVNSGAPLSPRDLILDLREHANDRSHKKFHQPLTGNVIDPEALWSCAFCGACMEICPVGIEHPPLIVQMRRNQIDQAEMTPQLQGILTTISNTGNSFGEPARTRGSWAAELPFKIKDARREACAILWFVGDYAAFDPRNQIVSRTVAKLLRAAGVDFAILYEGEHTAGNDVRRVGEEGLFEALAGHNIEQFMHCKPFQSIMTTDPHSFNTLKNEYPHINEMAPVQHYSEVLLELLTKGALSVVAPLNKKVTYHDPCHLGRLNGIYDAPRDVLKLIGCELIEMPRNRDNSFCCGAGGGQIWMPSDPSRKKPSENRIKEAAALEDVRSFITCCPKDLTMFEDARKTSGHEDDLVVEDIVELIAEATGLDGPSANDMSDFMGSITTRLMEGCASRLALVATPTSLAVSQSEMEVLVSSEQGIVPVAKSLQEEAVTPDDVPAMSAPTKALAPQSNADLPVLHEMSWDVPAPVLLIPLEIYEKPEKVGLRILVSVKHIAVAGDEFEFSDDGRQIDQAWLEYQLNEWDDAALELALQLVESQGAGEVVVVSVGPKDAETSVRKALAKGAHRAVRVWGDKMIDAGPMVIAQAISAVAKQENADLVICGVQSGDEAHGSTGAAVAGILDFSCAVSVLSAELDEHNMINLVRELEGGIHHQLRIQTPAVLTVQTGMNTRRYATMRMVKQARKKPLVTIDGAALTLAANGFFSERLTRPEVTRAQILDGTVQDIAGFVAQLIKEKL